MTNYSSWIPNRELVTTIEDADLVFAEGGADWQPFLYQQEIHPTTFCEPERDKYELPLLRKAVKLGKPICGICRGAQGLAILAEAELIQHQPNPGNHLMKTFDKKEFMVSSTHHQSQYPFILPENEYKILGWTEGMLLFHKNGKDEEVNPPVEVEVCYYPKIRGLAFQPHIEYLDKDSEAVLWSLDLLNKHMNNEL